MFCAHFAIILFSFVLPNVVSCKSLLLQGGTVLAWNKTLSTLEVLRDHELLIVDDRIVSLGPYNSSNQISATPDEVVDVSGMIVSPGLIDTHRHGWETLFRTIASNGTLLEFYRRYGEFPSAGKLTPEDVHISYLMGFLDSLSAGTTSILDHDHGTWSKETSLAGLRGCIDSGVRTWWSYAIHDLGTNFTINDQFNDLEDISRMDRGGWRESNVEIGLAYDRLALAPEAEVEKVLALANKLNLSVITMHQTGPPFQKANNSPACLNSYGGLNSSIPAVFAHAPSLDSEDMLLLRKYNQYVAITPESENHWGIGHPRSWEIQDQAALGVDTDFTFSSDMIHQARIWLQSVRLQQYEKVIESGFVPSTNPMSVYQAFLMATRHGGLALRRDDVGVIAVGAKADIAVFRGDSTNMLGWVDPVAAIVLHSSPADVEHVLVNGDFKKKDGVLTRKDMGDVKSKFLNSARRIQRIWKETPFPAAVGLNGTKVTDRVDTQRGAGNGYGTLFL